MMWTIARILSLIWMFKAAKRGPKAFVRQRARSFAMKKFNRLIRKIFPL